MTTEELLALLAATPARIDAATARRPAAHMHTPPGPDEWSVNDVLAHLRSCADVWGGYIARILSEDHPTFRASNPRAEINRKNYPELDFRKSFRAFAKQRADLLSVLESLRPEDWRRAATVTNAGRPLQPTVHSYAQRMAVHERSHVKQIATTVEAVRAIDQE